MEHTQHTLPNNQPIATHDTRDIVSAAQQTKNKQPRHDIDPIQTIANMNNMTEYELLHELQKLEAERREQQKLPDHLTEEEKKLSHDWPHQIMDSMENEQSSSDFSETGPIET